jgi:acyl carrier protein
MDEHAKAIEEFIVNEITDGLELGALPHDEDLLAADLIDSLGITELIGFLESRFGIAVGDEDLAPENFRSVDSIVAFVARKGG